MTQKFRRVHMQKLLLICCALFMGCASTHVETGMVTQASAEAEPHVIWTRPLEVGFEMGRYIEGESTTKRLFGCMRVDGDPVQKKTTVPMLGCNQICLSQRWRWQRLFKKEQCRRDVYSACRRVR